MTSYLNHPNYVHGSKERLGILLVNLGSPDAPTEKAVRKYLAEFLWDPRVVETPRPLWWLILNGFILRTRPRHSAAMYKKIWTDEGSPLISISRLQAQKVEQKLQSKIRGNVLVDVAMRYGNPTIANGLRGLRSAGAKRFLILPMYPQYSATTTASVFDAVTCELQNWRWLPDMRFINSYHDQPAYIDALAKTIINHWSNRDRKPDILVFSFHGIPKSYVENGDPYFCHCQKTARLVAEKLLLKDTKWKVTFQSRVGREEWLQPYTDTTMKQLAYQGVKTLDVVCPGFSADCLETLEEINMENREIFLNRGGVTFDYIPCLNASDFHINALSELIIQHSFGWPETMPGWDAGLQAVEANKTSERATKMGSNQ
jgi:protoporphyrin/coproporphyrin ferrochelatase